MDKDYEQALSLVLIERRAGAAYLKQKLMLSDSKVQRILKKMEIQGVVSKMGPGGTREVLRPAPLAPAVTSVI